MAEMDTQQLDTLLSSVRTLEPLIREHADEAEQGFDGSGANSSRPC